MNHLSHPLVAFMISLSVLGCTKKISPHDLTVTAIGETAARVHLYVHDNGAFPDNLLALPERSGYANRSTDAWGESLIYSVDPHGVVLLESRGRDGRVGGVGDDEDIARKYRMLKSDGSRSEDWFSSE